MRFLSCRWSLILLLIAISTVAFAAGSPDCTQVGHDINIDSNEDMSDATCFGCSVRVRGHVDSDVTVFGGSIVIEEGGQVDGDTTAFGGGVRLEQGVKVGGDVTVFGGRIQRNPGASVGGDLTNFSGSYWIFLIFGLPLLILGGIVTAIILLVRYLLRPSVPAAA